MEAERRVKHINSFLLIVLIISINVGVSGLVFQEKVFNLSKTVMKKQLKNGFHSLGPNYKTNELDSPPVLFTGNFWDYGLDTDSDNRYDFLVIAIEINITLKQYFFLYIEISRNLQSFSESFHFSMDPGIKIVNVSFETPIIHKTFFSSNDPLSFRVSWVEIEYVESDTYWFSDRLFNAYTTKKYFLNELELDVFPIDSNAFFTYVASFERWQGTGTIIDPYIINDTIIDSIKRYIEVKNTERYFYINNCVITGGRTGISLENVRNAFITNNDISKAISGIKLRDCYNVRIEHNKIHTNTIGIVVGDSPYLSAKPSNNNTIMNNLIYHNHKHGVYINPTSCYNQIESNDFLDNNPNGFSQAYDQGRDNNFVGNYWQLQNNEVDMDSYPIDGTAQNMDISLAMTPNHLTKPIILTPNEGEVFTNQVVIRWKRVNDTFNQEITYSVFYSSNAGESWDLLSIQSYTASDETEDWNGFKCYSYLWEVGFISPAQYNYLLRVIATDSSGFITKDTAAAYIQFDLVATNHSETRINTSNQLEPLLPYLQLLSLGSVLFFIVTVVVVIDRQTKTRGK